ncbi:zinc finger BED domain-containing protein 4-like [Halictus rubicundus]|uniref:zinc finger BED domain-containing protein 4-like n=1 Tax=Halictus rubicundus TaxID=77578 RepID=UPI00403538AA
MEVGNVEMGVVVACNENSPPVEVDNIRRSTVWKWFTKTGKEECLCNLCKKILKCKRSSTTSLKRHLECQHRDAYFTDRDERLDDQEQVKEQIVMLQSNSPRAKEITTAIAEMMISDCQPFSVVNDSGFRKVVKVLEPRYNLPSRTTFSENIVPAMYENEKKRLETQLKKDMENTESFAFTTDGWTSRSNENYLSVTVHYLDGAFNMQNFTLKISNVTEAHTSEHINSFLKNTLAEWNLDNAKFQTYFVTDNAANIVKAVRLSPTWQRIPCFAHTLQLVIKDAIKPCRDLISTLQKCRAIVRYFHRSPAANEKLRMEQLMQYPKRTPLKLINDCETRWNSQYDMLMRLIDLFKEATEILTVENKPTLPRYIPTIFGIRDTLMSMLEMDDVEETLFFKQNLIFDLGSRFKFATTTNCLVVSMILDPRIKDRLLSTEKKQEAIELLHAFAIKYEKPSPPSDASVADGNIVRQIF